jgi:hypothetical protein
VTRTKGLYFLDGAQLSLFLGCQISCSPFYLSLLSTSCHFFLLKTPLSVNSLYSRRVVLRLLFAAMDRLTGLSCLLCGAAKL